MQDVDYYELLGVGRDASTEEITQAFRQRAKKYHPKLNPGDRAAEKIFREMVVAYRVLTNEGARRKYDLKLAPAAQPSRARRPRRPRRRIDQRAVPSLAKLAQRPRRTADQVILRTVKRVPSWLLSAAVHALLVYVLAGWPVNQTIEVVKPPMVLDIEERTELPELELFKTIDPEPPAVEPLVTEADPEMIEDQAALDEIEKQSDPIIFAVGKGDLKSRAGRRAVVVGRGKGGGTTKGSETAVEAGLLWLAGEQLRSGEWAADRETANWAKPGLTGLAVLAFQGAGYTHQRGKYADVLQRAIAWLKRRQDTDGCIAMTSPTGGKRLGGYMYCHGIGTLALVEAYGMTKDPLLREPAERGIDFIVQTQNDIGGWRYYHNSKDGDSSISGWMVMALHSAKLADISVPEKTWDGARKFFDTVTNKEKGYTVYMEGLPPSSPGLVAVGLLAHQYMGLKRDDPYIALASMAINKFPPKWVHLDPKRDRMEIDNLPARHPGANDYYFWYYANLALHQRRGDEWEKWHPQVRDTLVKHQERQGDDRGSWPPISRWSGRSGRVYSTAMAILALEVYYRYAPMYREVVDVQLAAYGEALTAYNDFVRLHKAKKTEAEAAGEKARAEIGKFLDMSKPVEGQAVEKATLARRSRTALMLLSMDRAEGRLDRVIAGLETLHTRYPGCIDEDTRQRQLAGALLSLSKHLAKEGHTEQAAETETRAIGLYHDIAANADTPDPKLQYWLAKCYVERREWHKALRIYRKLAKPYLGRKLDPKSQEGRRARMLFNRIVECYVEIAGFRDAGDWLERIEAIEGTTLAILRRRAELLEKQNRLTEARQIYRDALQRLPKYGKEWWATWAEELDAAYRLGEREYIVRTVGKMEVLHPEFGNRDIRRRALVLRRQAEGG
jgi:tetratricopeptide (TPR) repeat protein